MKNIIPSAARTIAIGKYLVALSLSFLKTAPGDDQKSAKRTGSSGRRRQLHVLYLVNDLLHHTKYHIQSPSAYSMLTQNLQNYLVDLFGAASAYSLDVYVKQHKRITDLLNIWEGEGYYRSLYIHKLRDTATNASKAGYANTNEDLKLSEEALSEEKRDAPYILPPSHGDPMTPFYDLPAGNMMPHIIPNSARAINPQLVKALQFTAGPADESLVIAVKDFLRNVESLDPQGFKDVEHDTDIDELGQCVLSDEIARNVPDGEGYYGWSRGFCERMKRGAGFGDIGMMVGRAGSIDRSSSPRKRRRYSDSGSSRGRDRTKDKSRSSSLSSSSGSGRRNGRRSSISRGFPTEQRRYRSLRSQSRSRSPSYSPPQTISVLQRPSPPASLQPMQQTQAQGPSHPPPPPLPKFSLGPGGFPIPPPPPPNYHGPWPPPPPPMPSNGYAAPTGPKVGQMHGASTYQRVAHPAFQNQASQNFAGWSQQHSGPVNGPPLGDHGGAQQPFNGSVQNGRGRGGRGGWSR